MKYFVIATKWSSEEHKQVREIVGAFEKAYLAVIFKDAYNKEFSATAEVVEAKTLL